MYFALQEEVGELEKQTAVESISSHRRNGSIKFRNKAKAQLHGAFELPIVMYGNNT